MKKFFLIFVLLFSTILVGAEETKIKYVFYFIGDGMGMGQVNAVESYRAFLDGKIGVKKLGFTQFPALGLATTYAMDRYITDSAAAGTALATGNKTSVETIGMDAKRQNPFTSIAKLAKKNGYKVGIITKTNMNDATPSSFYANQAHRKMYKEIAGDLYKSNFDLFAGGGLRDVEGIEAIKNAGYTIVNTRKELMALKNKDTKYYAFCPRLDEFKSCPYYIDRKSGDASLSDFVKKSSELLFNDKGFFVMVEGGKIDWANHSNDALTAFNDIIEFDDAIKTAVDFYNKHPKETLIVVTSDHETGGFAFGNYNLEYNLDLKKIKKQKKSRYMLEAEFKNFKNFGQAFTYLKNSFGFTDLSDQDKELLERTFETKKAEAFGQEVMNIMAQRTGIGWTSDAHTGTPVAVFSKGQGQDLYSGYIDNTDVAKNTIKLMGL